MMTKKQYLSWRLASSIVRTVLFVIGYMAALEGAYTLVMTMTVLAMTNWYLLDSVGRRYIETLENRLKPTPYVVMRGKVWD